IPFNLPQLSTIKDLMQLDLLEIQSSGSLKSGEKDLADLHKRKLIAQRKGQWFTVQKGSDFSTSTAKPETDLTVDMLTLFAEMPTASFVESSFWCSDALFVPQQHPARDLQDIFYVSDPPHSLHPEPEYYKRVSTVHEHGGFGSMGYRAPWSHEETTKLLLRTHTTASSAHMLYKLAAKCRGEDLENDWSVAGKEGPKDDGFRPAKLFSIDRVFQNETTDATHLAEFHQVEGVVADRGLTLADLIGFMKVFFNKMGIEQPSLEIFAFHPMLDRWVEVGNSGMFRPEMLEQMGFPKDVQVHRWGLGLERPTMIRTETHTLTGPQYIPRGETNQATSNRRDIQVGDVGGTCGQENKPKIWKSLTPHASATALDHVNIIEKALARGKAATPASKTSAEGTCSIV
ncbi:tRNA synthetases class II core domain (F)-domain-containing protein, partial [Mycena olivaceomarginata]